MWNIRLAEEVLDRKTGKTGRAVQVLAHEAYVRFEEGQKAKRIERARLIPVRTLAALAEVDEDDANAKAYRQDGKADPETLAYEAENGRWEPSSNQMFDR